MLLVLVWYLTLLHSERPKLYAVMAFLSAIGLMPNKFKSDGLGGFSGISHTLRLGAVKQLRVQYYISIQFLHYIKAGVLSSDHLWLVGCIGLNSISVYIGPKPSRPLDTSAPSHFGPKPSRPHLKINSWTPRHLVTSAPSHLGPIALVTSAPD